MTAPTTAPPAGAGAFLRSCEVFADRVRRLCAGDRGAQAALRRGLGQPVAHSPRLHRYVVPLIRQGMHRSEQQAFYTVASLIAAAPRTDTPPDSGDDDGDGDGGLEPGNGAAAWRPSLGASMGRAVAAGRMREGSAEDLLFRLTRSPMPTLIRRLPPLISQLSGAGGAVDFPQLLADLRRWEFRRDQVAERWLQDFYGALRRTPDADGDGTEPGDGGDAAAPLLESE